MLNRPDFSGGSISWKGWSHGTTDEVRTGGAGAGDPHPRTKAGPVRLLGGKSGFFRVVLGCRGGRLRTSQTLAAQGL